MYGYVYLTTNMVNGKQYIGQHKSAKFDKRYKGSGRILKYAIEKYGRDKFITIILETYESKEDLDNGEIYWIAKYGAVENENFYNIEKGGQPNGRQIGHEVSDDTRQKLRKINLGKHVSDETKAKLRLSLKGIHAGDKNPAKREDVRAKFRVINAGENSPVWGKHWYNNGKINTIAETCPEGFVPGKLFKETKFKNKRHWYNNGVKSIKAETCPEGFVHGRLQGVAQ